jgi:3-dehydroshikimate dehydratase
MKTGLCSVTLRNRPVEEVVRLIVDAQLDAVEWGGDIHVPVGDEKKAVFARRCCEESGIQISSYGSYYRIINREGPPEDIRPILDTALALGAPAVRVWAGYWNSADITPENRERLLDGLNSSVHLAGAYGLKLALEFHINTLTDTAESTEQLLSIIDAPNFFTYWQPPYWIADTNLHLEGLRMLKRRILNLHVFHWRFNHGCTDFLKATERRPLEEGSSVWAKYLREADLQDGTALIEFVRDDEPGQFIKDAAVLRGWIDTYYRR